MEVIVGLGVRDPHFQEKTALVINVQPLSDDQSASSCQATVVDELDPDKALAGRLTQARVNAVQKSRPGA